MSNSLLHEKAETFFSHTESTVFVRHSSEYETSDNDRKASRNIYQMRIDSRDTMNTASDWPLSDVSYSDECRTKIVLSVCEKNVSAFSCNSEVLQYQQIIHISKSI